MARQRQRVPLPLRATTWAALVAAAAIVLAPSTSAA
jgi:hypothetical protein